MTGADDGSPGPCARSARGLKVGFRVGQYPCLSETFIAAQIAALTQSGSHISIHADQLGPAGTPEARHTLAAAKPRGLPTAWLHAITPWRIREAWLAATQRRWAQQQEVIVCNFGWFGASLARALGGCPTAPPFVTIFHGDDVSRSLQQGNEGIYEELFASGNLLLTVSELWRSRLLSLGAPEERVRIHHMGVNLAEHPFAPKMGDERRPSFRIVHVARLVEKKGTEYLLRAIARLRGSADLPSLELDIIGSGPLEAKLRQLSEEFGLADVVHFLGPLPHDGVRRQLATADLFVLPSVTAADGDMEGIPVVLMEAMATGLPVVSTRHSGIPELVRHEHSGLLADERDEEELFHQIHRIMQDSQLRRHLVTNARQTIEREFDQQRQNQALAEILLELARTRD